MNKLPEGFVVAATVRAFFLVGVFVLVAGLAWFGARQFLHLDLPLMIMELGAIVLALVVVITSTLSRVRFHRSHLS